MRLILLSAFGNGQTKFSANKSVFLYVNGVLLEMHLNRGNTLKVKEETTIVFCTALSFEQTFLHLPSFDVGFG